MIELTVVEQENLLDQLHSLTLQRQTDISDSGHTLQVLDTGKQYQAKIVSDSTIYVESEADIPLHSAVNVNSGYASSHGSDCLVTAVTPQAGRQALQVLPVAGRFDVLQANGSRFTTINSSVPYVKISGKNYVAPLTIYQGDIVDPEKGPLLQIVEVIPADNGLDEITLRKYQGN